jgi:hypothetical protein
MLVWLCLMESILITNPLRNLQRSNHLKSNRAIKRRWKEKSAQMKRKKSQNQIINQITNLY